MTGLKYCVVGLIALLAAFPAQAAELVMVEESGCIWCARWTDEIAPAYPKTEEGKFAPLRRVDINEIPPELQVSRKVRLTPTFLIVNDNRELARMEGYPGDEFFWPVLAGLLKDHAGFEGGTE